MAAGNNRAEVGTQTGRVEAFSDGVFAIAVTLLILDIKVPRELPEGASLTASLLGQWPAYLAFVISFATIAIMWINHRRLFTLITRSDHTLLVLNSLLLLGVTFVPYPTAVLSEYMGTPQGAAAAILYSGTFAAIAILFNLLWHFALRHGLLGEHVAPTSAMAVTRQYLFGPLIYGGAALLALVSVPASVGLNLLLALFFALPERQP